MINREVSDEKYCNILFTSGGMKMENIRNSLWLYSKHFTDKQPFWLTERYAIIWFYRDQYGLERLLSYQSFVITQTYFGANFWGGSETLCPKFRTFKRLQQLIFGKLSRFRWGFFFLFLRIQINNTASCKIEIHLSLWGRSGEARVTLSRATAWSYLQFL
jgi:hypothetical protein